MVGEREGRHVATEFTRVVLVLRPRAEVVHLVLAVVVLVEEVADLGHRVAIHCGQTARW